eukprot:TRINITY_DN91936_c0_g1_i1.p1 TRINITY_DN91936_c0_g1~~TRINITY_DN91936_c0_g1_i1.p1  ORF type:complete len:478 (+),score=75.28 TRINITY_DN91936_c0_g1_i1:31-1464(+)
MLHMSHLAARGVLCSASALIVFAALVSRQNSNILWIAAQLCIALLGVASAVAVPKQSLRLIWRQYFLAIGVFVCVTMVVSVSIDCELEGLNGSAALFFMMAPAALGFAGVFILCKYRTDVLAHPSKEVFMGPVSKGLEQWSNIKNTAPCACWCTAISIRSSVRIVILSTALNVLISCFYICYRLYVFPANFFVCLFPVGLLIFSAARSMYFRGENVSQNLIIARHTLILLWLAGFMTLAAGLWRLEEVFGGVKGGCFDRGSSCAQWSKNRYCEESSRFQEYMIDDCPASCGLCDGWEGIRMWRLEVDILWIVLAVLLGPAWRFSWSFHRGTRQLFLVGWGLDAGLLDEVHETPVHEIPLRLQELAEQRISATVQDPDTQDLEMAIAESYAIAESLALAKNENDEHPGAASGASFWDGSSPVKEGTIIGAVQQLETQADGTCDIQGPEEESSVNPETSELEKWYRTKQLATQEGGLQL